MIFPILGGLVGWRRAPITWLIVFLTFSVQIYTSSTGEESQVGLEELMKKHYFVEAQGQVYAQYLEGKASEGYPKFLLELAQQVRSGSNNGVEILGQLAFRDANFLRKADTVEFDGDKVAFNYWRKHMMEVRSFQSEHPSFAFGLNADESGIGRWISYIFVHSGWLHFVGNMIFLTIFGAALEAQIGGLAVLTVFLLSGTFAAGVFALMTGVTSAPLVGGSGAISGIMTLYCVMNWSRPARYFYWLFLPFRGFMGLVFLPTWVGLIFWVISDLSGYLSSVPELGGVAHTAHLGGEAAGVVTALTLLILRRQLAARAWEAPPVPMGVLIPFLPVDQRPHKQEDVVDFAVGFLKPRRWR